MKSKSTFTRKKPVVVSTSVQPWNPENATILSAMEYITSDVLLNNDENEELEDETYRNMREEVINYLCERLSLPRLQTLLLSYILYENAQHPNSFCDMQDLANMLHVHPLRMMQMTDDLHQLETIGYINNRRSHNGHGWVVAPMVIAAFSKDQVFDVESIRLGGNSEFLEQALECINEGMRHDPDDSIADAILRIMMRNTHLPIVSNLQRIPSQPDMWFMLLMMVTLAVEHDECVSSRDIERMLSSGQVRQIFQQLQQGVHPFAQKGYVTLYNQGGMAQNNLWTLSDQAWVDMLGGAEEADLVRPTGRDNLTQVLTRYTDIVPRQLFFSSTTQEQVNRLMHFLSEKEYANICQALKQRGMPTGFCCLFYGTPGTGKTELVQQLAIATQRDLFQVDLSSLRDKFVGESEKQVKRIFDRYRALVHSCERAPILFFNEADGIFGNRMENTQRSVDKMENAIQNIILQEMERLEGIMICTTNLTTCLDKAFDRRFLFKLQFDKPTNEARKCIWQSMLEGLNDEQATYLANHFDFSGGQIQNISRKQVIHAIFTGKEDIDYEQIKIDCQNESISRNNGRKIGF
jgi:hypothetical protein